MKGKEKDYVVRTVACQAIVSIMILALVFGLSKTGSGVFTKLSADLLPLLSASLTKEEADDAFKEISEVLFSDDIAEMVNGWAARNSNSTAKESEKSEETSQATESTENAASTENTASTKSTAETTKSTESADTGLKVTVEGDKNVKKVSKILGSDGKEIEASVSERPYTLSGTIYTPLSGKITSAFGERVHPVYEEELFHSGIDIAGSAGDLIRSMYDGTVIHASYNRWNGNFIIIDHGNGITTVYCHCSKLLCQVGTVVRGGEAIARVGSTGVSTGPHLHFEFRINGISYNPVYALNCAADAV